jgi:hypothetical protein
MARQQFANELARNISDKRSGVFFITTTRKRAISLGLTDGWITYCSGIREHGQAAIEQLTEVEIASYRFTPDADFPFRGRDEVVHEEAIATIEMAFGELTVEPAVPAPAEEPSTPKVGVKTRIYRGQVIEIPDD